MVSNALDPPADEGIKKCAQELALVLATKRTDVHPIGRDASFLARKLLVSRHLLRSLRENDVRGVIYVPTQSATIGSLVRSGMLRSLAAAKVVMLALQPRDLGTTGRAVARYLRPDVLLTPSPSMLREAERSRVEAAYLQLGVDLERFQPPEPGRRRELRRKYGLPDDKRIVLHVGHATPRRGLEWLIGLGRDVLPLVVIGKSLGFDRRIVALLRDSGVCVLDQYLPEIHEIYQLADAYAFPVRHERSAIGSPLSVLEAMACNLPVVTTPFGALPRMIREGFGLFFASDEARFRACVGEALRLRRDEVRTRDQVLPYSWTATADDVLTVVKALVD